MADAPTRFFLREVATRVGPLALVTMDNGEDWQKPNVFGRAAFESLVELLPRLQDDRWSGLVLTGKPFVFAAGRRPGRVPAGEHAGAGACGGEGGARCVRRAIRDLPYPTLAAVNGAALGGGLEIALHCDFRTLARSVRHLGFPEVFLGIVPAWGGTQLVPRLVGAAAAVELIVANPLRQNRLTAARSRRRSSASPTRSSTTSSFSTTRSSGSSRAIDEGRPPRAARRSRRTQPRSARRRATQSTMPSTVSRSRRIARST